VRSADFLFEGAGQGCTFVLDRLFFRDVQEFCRVQAELVQQFHYHDWLVYLLARAWGFRWAFDDRSFIDYRQHLGNEIGARVGLAAIGRRLSLIRSGWYRRQVEIASQIYRMAGGNEVTAVRICRQFVAEAPKGAGISGRVARTLLLLRHGRRRFSDRVILAVACLLGHL
jgi:rhamnosyltransferase